jgi:hypothetical protein
MIQESQKRKENRILELPVVLRTLSVAEVTDPIPVLLGSLEGKHWKE